MTLPAFVFPPGPTVTSLGTPPLLDLPVPFGMLPPKLQGMGTTVIYVDPLGNLFDLAGPNAGRQGVRLWQSLNGDQQWPFEQVFSHSPYIMGASINRQNIPERKFNLGVVIGSHNPPMSEYQYRMAEDAWWAGQDETNDAWMGVYTRFSGWRWIPVRPCETVKTPQAIDSTAFGNNASRWDLEWCAARPYFTKPALFATWQAATSGPAAAPPGALLGGLINDLIGPLYHSGTLHLANRGDLPSFVSYLVSSPGQAIVQDNNSTRMVTLPHTAASTGSYLCDTEPAHRTLTAANDPQDNLLFDLIRQSQILNFFLSGVAQEGLPLMLAFTNRFLYQIPPATEVAFTVYHSNPAGVITASVPQRFKRSR
jgi:hypothetical protein